MCPGSFPRSKSFSAAGVRHKYDMTEIKVADTDAEIMSCFPVLVSLRPHLERTRFVADVRRLEQQGYRLAYVTASSVVKAVAGFRISESFAWQRYLYIDDLVTAENERSEGHGGRLFDWLVEYAITRKCDQLHLESGVQRHGAHKFYLLKGMKISSHHFQLQLSTKVVTR